MDDIEDISKQMLRQVQLCLDNQNTEIDKTITKCISMIKTILQENRIDARTQQRLFETIFEDLKYEVRTNCNNKTDRLYEGIYSAIKHYIDEPSEDIEEGKKGQKRKAESRIQDEKTENKISTYDIETSVKHYLENMLFFLARAGISDKVLEEIRINNKSIQNRLIREIENTVISTEKNLDTIIENALEEIFSATLRGTTEKEALSAEGIFDAEEKKTWELSPEEATAFEKRAQEVSDRRKDNPHTEEPNKGPIQELDYKDIF